MIPGAGLHVVAKRQMQFCHEAMDLSRLLGIGNENILLLLLTVCNFMDEGSKMDLTYKRRNW
jgi:hypothetical protein